LGYTKNRKTEGKNIQNRKTAKKFRPKPKTANKTVKNLYHGDKPKLKIYVNAMDFSEAFVSFIIF